MFAPYVFKAPLGLSIFSLKQFNVINPHWLNHKLWISSLAPPYPSNAFNRFMDIVIHHKRLPHSAYTAVTANCPYNCPFCSYGNREYDDLTTEQWIDIIQQLKQLGTAIIGITGGEPLLRNDLEKIIKETRPEMSTIIFTTGYQLTKSRAQALADAGTDCITIGLEYTDEKKQDTVKKGKHSFQYAKNAIKYCNDVGIFSSIATIGTREKINNGEMERLYDLAVDWDIGEIRVLSPVATGKWLGKTDEILSKKEFDYLRQFHKSKNKTGKRPIITWTTYYESSEIFGCITGFQYIFVDAKGNICPCDLTPLSFGNIKEKSIKTIWNEMNETFPRPRYSCLMNDISSTIKSDALPLPPDKSINIVPKILEDDPKPKVSKYFKK